MGDMGAEGQRDGGRRGRMGAGRERARRGGAWRAWVRVVGSVDKAPTNPYRFCSPERPWKVVRGGVSGMIEPAASKLAVDRGSLP